MQDDCYNIAGIGFLSNIQNNKLADKAILFGDNEYSTQILLIFCYFKGKVILKSAAWNE